MSIEKHFCITNYVIDVVEKKFLLIKHKKLQKWLPPGGHIEINETPDEAALRETYEETGLKVTLIGERLPRTEDLIRPFAIQLNQINPGHQHMDLIYVSQTSVNLKLTFNNAETDGIAWFDIAQISSKDFETFDTTKNWCKKFFALYLA